MQAVDVILGVQYSQPLISSFVLERNSLVLAFTIIDKQLDGLFQNAIIWLFLRVLQDL